jgi:hypothetical protein
MRMRRHDQDGNTVLINAAKNDHSECVFLLLKSGADMEAKNEVREHARVSF